LIASTSDIDTIARFIGADALIYQEQQTLANAIGLKDLCLACLDGSYPTEHARRIRNNISQSSGHSDKRDYEREFS